MIRKIIKIDEDLCNGCSLCASACHEGAIEMVDNKAKLIRDDYCDGLGNCLPVCPTGAISFEEREAAAFDEEAVAKNMEKNAPTNLACGCPSTHAKTLRHNVSLKPKEKLSVSSHNEEEVSQLQQWPVQIQLVPVNAPYFNGAHLLIAADCTAYAHPSFNQTFMRNKITIIGCPKLDSSEYTEKSTAILSKNDIKSVTIVRMEVPCCGGIVSAATNALRNSGKMIPWNVVTLGTDGSVLED